MVSKALLEVLLPLAVSWCRLESQRAAREGLRLTETALDDARRVGVTQPESVRVLVVDAIPVPREAALAAAAESIGFLGPQTAGLTLGYSIFVRHGRLSRRLLSHELRHVFQFEQAGSLETFLASYLASIVEVGYGECPFEVDARRNELPNANLMWRPLQP